MLTKCDVAKVTRYHLFRLTVLLYSRTAPKITRKFTATIDSPQRREEREEDEKLSISTSLRPLRLRGELFRNSTGHLSFVVGPADGTGFGGSGLAGSGLAGIGPDAAAGAGFGGNGFAGNGF